MRRPQAGVEVKFTPFVEAFVGVGGCREPIPAKTADFLDGFVRRR
jgi:hypothetical protein